MMTQESIELRILIGIILLVTCLVAKPVYSAATKPLASLNISADFVRNGRPQNVTLLPPLYNTYTNINDTHIFAAGGFIGLEHPFQDNFFLQLGVAGYADTSISVKGEVWQMGVPCLNDLAYNYHILLTRVMMEGKFLTHLPPSHKLYPYLSWQVGAAFNKASGYQEEPFVIGAVPTAPFANHMRTSLAWGTGMGADYSISAHTRLGLGYQFLDLGKASLGRTPASLTPQSLNFQHFYTNQIRLQFTRIG